MSKHPAPSAFDAASPAGDDHLSPPIQAGETGGQHPVPAVQPKTRVDGWTTEKQVIFLQALASEHCVTAAAKAAGMHRGSAYRLRARLKGEPFDWAWDAAFQCSFDALGQAAMDRALNGVERHHYYKGELVGTSRKFDERLTIALLAMRHVFLRDPPPFTHSSAAYETDDFRNLLERVKQGPDSWE